MAGPDPIQLAMTFIQRADDAQARGEDELTWGWLQKSLSLYRSEGDHWGIAAAGQRLASLHARRGDLNSALTQAREAREHAEQAWSRPDMARIDYVIGAIHCQLGEVEVGLRWLHRSVDMWGELGQIEGQLRAWRRIAHAQAVDGDLSAGMSAWERCLNVYRHQQDLAGEALIHAEMAQACNNARRPDLAVPHALAALGRHRRLQSDRATQDLGMLVEIQIQLEKDGFEQMIRRILDADATELVLRLVAAEHTRRYPPPPPPTSDLPPAVAALLTDEPAPPAPEPDPDPDPLDDDVLLPGASWEQRFWSQSTDEPVNTDRAHDPTPGRPADSLIDGLFDHLDDDMGRRSQDLVDNFGKVIGVLVVALLGLLFVALIRALILGT